MDILLKLKEKGKQSISFTGGVSGLSGSFIGLSYQTNNFLGLGETLTPVRANRQDSAHACCSVSPSRICSTGPFRRALRFPRAALPSISRSRRRSCSARRCRSIPNIEQDYNQNTTGVTVFASYPLRKFSFTRLGLTYGYSDTSIQSFSTASTRSVSRRCNSSRSPGPPR